MEVTFNKIENIPLFQNNFKLQMRNVIKKKKKFSQKQQSTKKKKRKKNNKKLELIGNINTNCS